MTNGMEEMSLASLKTNNFYHNKKLLVIKKHGQYRVFFMTRQSIFNYKRELIISVIDIPSASAL